MGKPSGEATHVINDDWKSRWNIGGARVPCNRPIAADISGFQVHFVHFSAFNCIWNREWPSNFAHGMTPFTALAKAS